MRRQVTPDELDTLYREIGKGIWHLQYVEDALNTLITLKVEIKIPGAVSAEEAQKKLAKHRLNTLGTSLRIAKENGVVSSEIEVRLSCFKEERDWLVHRSLNTHGALLYTEQGRIETFERLGRFFEEAKKLQDAIAGEITRFVKSHGVNTAEAERRAHAHIAKLKGSA